MHDLMHVTYDDIVNVPSYPFESYSKDTQNRNYTTTLEQDLCRRINDIGDSHAFAYLSYDTIGKCACTIDLLIPDCEMQNPQGVRNSPYIKDIHDILHEYFEMGGKIACVNLISQRTLAQSNICAPHDDVCQTRHQVYETILRCDEIEKKISEGFRQNIARH